MKAAAPNRTAAGLVAAVLILLVSACGAEIAGTPSVAPGAIPERGAKVLQPADLPYGRDARLVDAWATMRTWDLCAIQDPTEARNMLGGTGGSVVPYTDLSGCKVEVRTGANTWTFQLDATTAEHYDDKPTRVTVDGTQLNRYIDQQLGNCEYELPFRDNAALALTVEAVKDMDKQRTCQVGETYLHTVLPRMKNPPRAGTGASEPAVKLAGQDPCAGVAAIRDDLQRGGRSELLLNVRNPVECEVSASPPDYSRASDIISYGVRFNMSYSVEFDRGTKVTVAGLRGVSQKLTDCRTVLDAGAEPLVLSNFGEEYLQTIELQTPQCGQQELMERMLAPYAKALHAAPAPATADVVHIGDLNPPSTPKEVGAPFDPCTVVSWQDFPAGTHLPRDPGPHLADLNANDIAQTGCVFHGEKVVTTIGWSRDTLETLQQRNDIRGRPVKIGGRSATVDVTTEDGKTYCTNFVSAEQGTIAIASGNNFSRIDPCPVNQALLKVILRKVP